MRDDRRYPKWIEEKLRWLKPNPRLDGLELYIAQRFEEMARKMVNDLLVDEDDPIAVDQLLIGLQRLIDAKDPLVRVAVAIRQSGRFMTPEPAAPAKRKLFAVVSHAGLELATFSVDEAVDKVAELSALSAYQSDDKLRIEEAMV